MDNQNIELEHCKYCNEIQCMAEICRYKGYVDDALTETQRDYWTAALHAAYEK